MQELEGTEAHHGDTHTHTLPSNGNAFLSPTDNTITSTAQFSSGKHFLLPALLYSSVSIKWASSCHQAKRNCGCCVSVCVLDVLPTFSLPPQLIGRRCSVHNAYAGRLFAQPQPVARAVLRGRSPWRDDDPGGKPVCTRTSSHTIPIAWFLIFHQFSECGFWLSWSDKFYDATPPPPRQEQQDVCCTWWGNYVLCLGVQKQQERGWRA